MIVTADPATHPKPGCWVWGKKLQPMQVVKRGIVGGVPKFLVDGKTQPVHHSMIVGWCEDYLQLMWDAASIEDAKQLIKSPDVSIEEVWLFSLMLPPHHPYYSHNLPPAIKLESEFVIQHLGDSVRLCGLHQHDDRTFGIYKAKAPGGFYYVYRLLDLEQAHVTKQAA